MPAISPLLWRLSIIGTRALGLLPVRYLRAAYIIKSGPYARIKAKAAVCTLQVRPPNRSQGSLLSSPLNQPAEHKYRTDKPATRSRHRHFYALRIQGVHAVSPNLAHRDGSPWRS